MLRKLTLLLNFLVISAYNIDTTYPLIYPDNATNARQYNWTSDKHDYFGYSVLLHHDSQKNTSWLLIGAPRGNYTQTSRGALYRLNEPGVVYRCTLPGPCVEMEPSIAEDQVVYIKQIRMYARITKKHSWFGGAMSIEKSSGFLTVCAPRTIMSIILDIETLAYVDTMQGMCYSDRISSKTLQPEMSEIEHFDYSKDIWADPIHGFSVNFASSRDNKETISRIVGRPNDNVTGSINVARFARRNLAEIYRITAHIPIYDYLSLFGYAVTSGYYFDRNQSLYACADPGWNYVGQVTVIDTSNNSTLMITYVHGNDIGEYFGSSLATGDLNKDGLHDLIVGAPHWGNDKGRVHVYLGSSKGEFEAAAILEGATEDAQFGYAVASGDLDGDGFSDIIVSAPWEESGVIYVYNGDANLKDIKPVMSQKIAIGSNLLRRHFPANIETFGFSISEPIDIDENGYADIAIGAYKSGHVVVLRSKPVVRTNLTIYTVPDTLERNDRNFSIRVCVENRGYNMANIYAFKISLIVDKKYKRTKETSLVLLSSRDPPVETCLNASVTLLNNIQDFIEPIAIYALHDFMHNDSAARNFCKTCPIERLAKSRSSQVLLPFDIGCGDDRVCNSNISATVKFWGVRQNNTWVIGSNDIVLEAYLENHGEPAYLATIVFIFPADIVLRSILPYCEEDTDKHTLIVTCTVANPLGSNKKKVVKLDLDMKHLTNGSLHARVLEFSTEIKTRSVNRGTRVIKSLLTLQSEAFLFLNGKAIEESYHLSDKLDKDALNVTFQHAYQILKFGATSIEKAQLVINVPTTIVDDSGSLVFLYKPRVYISGEYHDCFSNEINLIDIKQNKIQEETPQNVKHDILKRDLNSRTIITRVLAMVYRGESKDFNGNLTTPESNIVYINCSTYGINCSRVQCDLSFLKTQQDVGKLMMRLILNVTKLRDSFGLSDETKIVRYSTDAHVEIIKPANRIFIKDQTGSKLNLTTEFHSIVQKLQLWIVFVSISLGLILLGIVVIILSTVGFFKRKTKEELSALKTSAIADTDDEE